MAPLPLIVFLCCAWLSLLPGSYGFLFNNSTSKQGLVIDTFKNTVHNDLGAWHGPGEKLYVRYGNWARRFVRLFPSNPDHNYHTQLSASCLNLTEYSKMYLHVVASGSHHFSISLYQNVDCDAHKPSVPLTADSVDATRYATGTHIYVPLSHFAVDLSKAHSIAFHGFYSPREVVLHKVEITPSIPRYVHIPAKQKTGTLVFRCKRPNSFAFGVDDGDPELAREVMKIFDDEGIQVTFFVVGKGLEDSYTNFTAFYKEMLQRGHQVALHSYSHPK
ncbi:hypothetical protein VTN31DRAFT_5398 [Thermomyces dupontii]|uniref:uncharacterized protein n=1 Tax=Talaromyces thermophilus TaxID=28565 RepID=UPI0037445DD1